MKKIAMKFSFDVGTTGVTEAYPWTPQASKMESFATIVS